MKVYQIHKTLYRISNNGKVKDVRVKGNKILEPSNSYNILTEEETVEILKHLK